MPGSADESVTPTSPNFDPAVYLIAAVTCADQPLSCLDGANDLGMIEAAGLGVAYHAKPAVAVAAAARIDYGDLTALLYAQGYRREEFVGR